MGLLSLLFSFNGRINRAQYWLGSIGVSVVGVMLFFAIGMSAVMSMVGAGSDAERMRALSGIGLIFPIALIMCWIGLALQIKRFHDRGRTGWFVMLPAAVTTPMFWTAITQALSGASLQQIEASMQPFQIALWVIQIGFFIDLGCLPSVEGPNKYGDPPGGSSSPTSYSMEPPKDLPRGGVAPANAPASAMSSLFGAQSAMDRAIAEQKLRPAPAAAKPAPGPLGPSGGAPSFGRRVAR